MTAGDTPSPLSIRHALEIAVVFPLPKKPPVKCSLIANQSRCTDTSTAYRSSSFHPYSSRESRRNGHLRGSFSSLSSTSESLCWPLIQKRSHPGRSYL